ncbi:MAG: FtsX-like permease family protein [Bacteroidetes bacterium]|nr:FtsX-like permease family protein [Bacteroidota bacterium]
MRRHAGYTAINVVGLAVGITVCLLITLYVRHELSYDRFHDDADRIVRVVSDWGDFSVPATSWPVVKSLEADYPDIPIARLLQTDAVIEYEDTQYGGEDIFITNPSFFDVFSFSLRRGDPETALRRPYTAVITPALAQKYFDGADPIGKTVTVDNQYQVEITGIAEAAPTASHIHYNMLVSWATLNAAFNYEEQFEESWGANSIYTYLLLPEGAPPSMIESQFPDFIDRHAGEDWNGATLSLQPLTSIHLHSHHNSEIEPNSTVAVLSVFGLIAALVLVLACVNFMNLATARATERATEVGVRKTVGAARGQLIRQFFAESMLMAALALGLALVLAVAALPVLQTLTGLSFTAGGVLRPSTLAALVVITGVAGGLAGSYPALYLSRFQPTHVLRGRFRSGGGNARLRQVLVVFQFAISAVLIVGTGVAYQQLGYLRSAPLGFDQEQVISVPMQSGNLVRQYSTFRSELLQAPEVTNVSVASTELPSELPDGNGFGFADAGLPRDSLRGLRMIGVGHDFFETLGVAVVAGRTFSLDRPSDSTAFVMNEEAFRLLAQDLPKAINSPQDVIGRRIKSWGDWPFGDAPLIGVVDNFHMATLHEAVEPMIFFIRPDMFNTYYVRFKTASVQEAVASLEVTWQRVFPDWPFAYTFADQSFDAAYRAEQRLGQLFGLFAGVAILIACLGLFGLAAFTTQQRTKEIGIRRALGATVMGVVALLTKDFVRLVAVAVVLAAPVAYFALDQWLKTFAHRIDLGASVFLIAGSGALLVALLTVSVQALRAARTDPARALRSE